jgi:osmotically-inducible protein OsmY
VPPGTKRAAQGFSQQCRNSDYPEEEIVLRNRSHFWRIASAVLLAGILSACSMVSGRETGDEYVDDATITTKVKTQLASDVGLTPANQIHVETSKRVVQLSGFVDSAAHKAEAESVARGVEGVQGVENSIVIQQ